MNYIQILFEVYKIGFLVMFVIIGIPMLVGYSLAPEHYSELEADADRIGLPFSVIALLICILWPYILVQYHKSNR